MRPKMNIATVVSVLSMIIVGVGSAVGQWATMKQWQEDADDKIDEKVEKALAERK